VHPPLRTTPVVRALNAAHGGQVCSTWGDFHYKTFDGDVFRFPGLCNYVFSAHCGAAYEDFNIQLRRGPAPNATAPSRVTMKLDGMVVELTKSSVLVNGRTIQLPFSQSGVLVEQSSSYVKVVARLGLVFLWNQDDSLLLELDAKYANKTCGLCGDFNGIPVFNEFLSHDVRLSPIEFGNLQKMDGPMEQCQDPVPESPVNCSTSSGICKEMLSELFPGCAALVDASSYLNACQHDLCRCQQANLTSCLCHTLAEYSRQCAHAGGQPLDWRGPHLCPQTCPQNTEYRECGSPCADTCSNLEHSQLCEDHCVAGCFCPKGMVLDDVGHTGCISVSECSCVYNGVTYAPGTGYSTDCSSCTCSGGRWSCQEVPCPGTCSVLGGAHFSTFDEREYTVHGDCSYVLAKPCNSSAFTVLAELRRCGLTDSETCLKSLTLSLAGGQTVIVVKASGEVFVNQIYTQLPVSTANVMLFRPSTFFIIAQTQLGLQLDVQLVPVMQVFVRLAPQLRGHTCGLCGNFNSIQADDFRTISGLVEGTAAAFANTWKTQAACPNIKNNFEDPCSLSVENEKYAQHWCSRLTDTHGPFARCHAAVNPSTYYSNCMFDTCNCEKSEDCMCAALSSYVRACAARGVLLSGWRDGVCTTPTATCPKSLTYRYHISTCQATCRARSDEGDATCSVSFVPVDGCTCSNDTFLDDTGKCVPATSCPCYYRGSVVPNGESLHDGGAVCTCTQGTLACIGGHDPTPVCVPPMVYFDCRNATPGATGAGCQKSCHTLDMDCYSSQCVPGCVCPSGLVASGEGGCIPASDCPCVHNEASYPAGQTIRVGCNTCTCKNRTWQCTDQPCLATCAVYGDGHYLTFDGQRYSFSGDCEYTLVQDHCSGNGSAQDGFRVITENIPCGTTGTTCSKAIKLFLGSDELKLSDGKVEVIETDPGQPPPFAIRQMGIYLVVDTDAGLVLLWDKKTSIFLTLSPEFKGRVCGLCGNFDGNALNDFTTRSQSVVGDVLEFGNSWKFSPSCPDARAPKDPCTANPYRKSWAQKQCSIINSATFSACRAHVEPARYYEACVSDACACDTGGDCECFCTAVAAYAQACHEVGVCVSWRTPDICPLFCDYYNPQGQCEWHYLPCGAPCMRTCRNPRGQCLHDIQGLEGCYPKCPPEAPIFDEDQMHCVTSCPTPPPPAPCRVQGKTYRPGSTVPSDENCHSCVCTVSGVQCTYDPDACVCTYDGRRFRPGEVIYHTSDGTGGCISARCGANGTIDRGVSACSPATPTPQTTFVFSTSPLVVSSTLPPSTRPSPATSSTHTPSRASLTTPGTPPGPTPHCGEECLWSPWLDVSRPGLGIDSGDFDTLENLRAHGYRVCRAPSAVECQAEDAPGVPLRALGQRVECSPTVGLICYNRDQPSGHCDNYQIRILCCSPRACPPGTSGFTSVLTGSTASSVPVTMTGPTTVPTTSITPGPGTPTPISGTSTPGPGSPTPAPGSPTPAPGTSTSGPGTPTPGPGTPTPAPGTSTSGPGTPTPCSWSKWFDVDFPSPGPHGGDFETYSNILRSGEKICRQPEYISDLQCRAQNHPEVSIQKLGQVVECRPEVGLVCRNQDQGGKFRICLNYEVRVLCCDSVPTTSTTSVQPSSSSSAPTTSATSVHTSSSSSAPTTSATSTSVPGSTSSSRSPTPCQPQCSWSKWFDVDFPSPGPHGGDFETYSNILRSGEKICRQPEYISDLQCRAQNHPEVSIQKLGQVVECRPEVGLVCRNQDQGPKKDCPVSPITLPTTTSVRVTSPPETSSHGATSSTTSTCYCSVSDRLYPAGSIIYEETDLSGHCYYAVCSLACRVVRRTDLSCPTSRPPPASSTPRPGGRALQLTLLPQKGETWPMPNCTEASCEGNGVISVRPRHCPKVQKPTCANGYPAVKVQRGRPVEPCWCVCSGWGDPHYITFDGTYYTFLDNCTYVLVQQIVPVYGHFRVLVDNYFCGAEDGLSCPQSIIVEYQQDRVVLTRRPVRGVMTNQIIFNNEVVSPGFRKDGIVVSQVGIKMYVAIPEIGVQVMFSGLIFSVEVPFSKFANNTEGQCGTCTNDQKDECRLPGGAVVASCSDMSSHWKVTLPGQPPCHAPPPRPTVVEPTTPPTSCPPSPICQVFAPCHAEIPPWPFFQGCVFDHCHMPDTDVLCSGLELYAALCASLGVCIDWRGRTNHTCPFPCPADTVYQPCGPSNPPYSPALTAGSITEGCFCPQGTMRFSTGSEVCVPADCSWCLGPHGEPVEPGHTVSFDCQECSCDGHTRTVSCRSQTCPLPPACQEPGLVPVPEALQSGQCCPQYSCACNTTRCPVPVECPEGSHLVLTYEEGACCPSYNWTSCSVNGTLYQPGAVVSSTLCETCRCEVPGGPESDTFAISCETQICSTYCPVGFEYQERQGQCCGFCKQVACVTNTSDSSVHLFYPGESWSDPGNRCVTHECEKHQEGLVVVTTRKACPPLTCPGGQAGADLGTPLPPACSSPGCAVYHQHQVLQQQSCRSAGPVRLTYCQGNCGDTASMYSPEANAVEHRCKCCQELQVALRNVTLHCPDGSSRAFSYTEVEKCGCVGQRCDSHGDLSLSEEEAPQLSRDAGHGLWRTGAPQPRPLQ
uniref:Mucin 5AC, oligomeric mucus/gel-forming n=1 Tax=Sus scrofa TaxID=9823 RepID=A0A8W4F836_PIG